MIYLRHASVEFTDWGCVSHFADGSSYPAQPHDSPHYHVVAHRLGYGDDLLHYTREHELAHHLWAEAMRDAPSRVLWALAHGEQPALPDAIEEEIGAQLLQRWVRANERPIVADVHWDALRARALSVMETQG